MFTRQRPRSNGCPSVRSGGPLPAIRAILSCLIVVLNVVRMPATAQVQIVHYSADHGLPFHDYLRERAEVFMARYPDIEVDVEIASGNYTEGVQVRIAAGVPVNVLDSTHSFMVFAIQNMLEDLRPHLERDNVDISGSILPSALGVLGHGSSILGLPSQVFFVGSIYNRTLLDEAGLPAPAELGDDWSWRWLREEARKLTRDKNGDGQTDQYAVTFARTFVRMDPFVHQAGGLFYDRYLDPTESRFNTEAVRVGLEFLVDLIQSGVATNTGAQQFFGDQRAVVDLSGTPNHLTFARESLNRFEVTTQPLGPASRGGATYFGPYHVLAGAPPEQAEAAYRWIRFLALDVESQIEMMEATGRLPAYLPILRDFASYLRSYPETDALFLTGFAQAATHPDNFPHYLTPAEAAIQAAFNPGFADVLSGRESLGNFLITMHEVAQTELNRVQRPSATE